MSRNPITPAPIRDAIQDPRSPGLQRSWVGWFQRVWQTMLGQAQDEALQAFDPDPARDVEPAIAAQLAQEGRAEGLLAGDVDELRAGAAHADVAWALDAIEEVRATAAAAADIARASEFQIEEIRRLLAAELGIQIPVRLTVERLTPPVDSIAALQVAKAADGSAVITVDTTNGRIAVMGTAPAEALDVTGNVQTSLAFKIASNQVVGARKAAVAISAQATTQTAGASYGSNEQTMLGNLKTDIANLITAVTALRDRLKTTGGHGLIAD